MPPSRDFLFEATDCACSALSCNCLQVACCLPQLSPSSKRLADIDVDNSRWMERLGNLKATIKFRDLVLVGAHDSASFSIGNHKPYSAVAKCQNLDTTQQLQAGIRILDVHVAPGKAASGITVWHGCAQGGDVVDTVLTPLSDFVASHPQEVVILQLVPELNRDFTLEQKKHTFSLVKEVLGSTILHGGHVPTLLQSWTLGDLRSQPGARVVVFVHSRFFTKTMDRRFNESSVLEEYGFAPMDKWLRNLWFNTNDMDTLMEYALDEVTRYGRQKRQFHMSQLVLRPGVGGFGDVVAALLGVNKLRPASLAFRLYDRLGRYLRQHANQGWNWVLFDFVDYGPWIVHFLTALNFPVTLKVHLAVYDNKHMKSHGVNVTSLVQACVCRNRVLYVDSFEDVLGLDQALGSLTIVYSLGKKIQVASLNLEDSFRGRAVLLSAYGNSCHEDSITTVPSDRSRGYLYHGSVLPESANVSTFKGTVLEFTNDDGVFSCQVYAPQKSRTLDERAVPQPAVDEPAPTDSISKQKVLVLVSQQSFDRSVVENQQNALTILKSKGVDFITVDGADPANVTLRNELFTLSNLRGKYPQFFIVEEDGTKKFWGDMAAFNDANEAGDLFTGLGGKQPKSTTTMKARSADHGAVQPKVPSRSPSTTDQPEVLVLVSQQSFDRAAIQNQQNAITILESKGIKYKTLDGADPANKDTRNELFALSGLRGKYPQFFLVQSNGEKTFWGNMETFDAANEDGTLSTALGGQAASTATSATRSTAAPEKSTSAVNGRQPQLLMLISQQSFDRSVVQNQQNAMTTLDSKGISYKTLDGADPANKNARSELFNISNLRGKYPQFFLVHGNGTKTFWGDMDTFHDANETGRLSSEFGGSL